MEENDKWCLVMFKDLDQPAHMLNGACTSQILLMLSKLGILMATFLVFLVNLN